MNLDPKTIIFINYISALLMSFGLLIISRGYQAQKNNIKNWSLSTLIQAISWALLGLRGAIPGFFSIILGNTFMLIHLALYFNILANFKGIRVKPGWIFIPVAISLVALSYFTYIIPHFGNRVIITSFCSSFIMFSCSFLLLSNNGRKHPTHLFTGFVFVICGSIMAVRTIIFIHSTPQPEDFLFSRNITNDILYFSYYISSLLLTFGFVLMCSDYYTSRRRLTEAELLYTKNILEESNQLARIGSWEIDFTKQHIYWSEVTREIHEVTAEEITDMDTGLSFYKNLKFGDAVDAIIKDARKAATSFDINLQIKTAKANERWVRVLGKSELKENRCTRVFGIIQDITKEMQLKEEVRLVEERFKNAFEHSEIGTALVGIDEKWIAVNQQMCNITGYTKAELINMTFKDITHPDDLEADLHNLQQVKEGQIKSYSMQKRYIHKNGNIIWIYLAVSAIRNEEKKVVQYIAQIKEISNRIETERQLKQSQQEYKSLFEQNPDAVYSLDMDGNLKTANDRLLEMAGCSREELFKLRISDLILPEESEKMKYHFTQAMKGIRQNFNATIINMKGRTYTLNVTNMPIMVDGVMVGNYGIAKDITKRIEAEQKQQKSYAEIRMLTNHLQGIREEERTYIAREIHDELGQLLTVLKMDILSLKNVSDALPEMVRGKTDQMVLMVDKSIQTVKKISTKLRPCILDNFGLIAALEWQAKEFQDRTNIICQFSTTCTSDNFSEKINTAVFRIFQESLTNVARHAKASRVSTLLYTESDMLILDITDNGIGISHNINVVNTSFGLLGMRERATMLNGDIRIQNAPGFGTQVKLKIPISC